MDPWKPADYELPDIAAVQAMALGQATPDQQQRALKWIVETVAGTYEQPYSPTSARDTDFALGKRHVGLQVVKATKLNLASLRKDDHGRSSSRDPSRTDSGPDARADERAGERAGGKPSTKRKRKS